MKQNSALLLTLFLSCSLLGQVTSRLQVRTFQLDNGLTVYLNEDHSVNKVFGAVAVNAGSKNDPADATGIAHYLEHLLFKGTTELGTWDYAAEKPHLDSISYWYEQLGKTQNTSQRAVIQSYINKHSVAASKYSLPNDFDNLLKSIGSTGVNAFTSPDMTFYHNSFPPNQIMRWLDIYAHRFQAPVFRSFQSELEVVYEEKNRAIDGFEYQILEEVMGQAFAPHPYGTQTTLGHTEHLKNPSLHKMYDFFKTYYVPNNMALILTGNFDSEEVIPVIKEKFGMWKRGDSMDFTKYELRKFTGKEEKKVRFTPIKAAILGYKTPPITHPDQAALDIIAHLLSNGSTGLLDQLMQDNKILMAQAESESLNDDGLAFVVLVPKPFRQSFGRAERHIFRQIERIRTGDFDDALLEAAKSQLYVDFQRSVENLTQRGTAIGYSFNQGRTWEEYLAYPQQVNRLTKTDIIRVAKQYYGDDYFAIYSRMGFPKKEKLQKPGYRPVRPETDKQSEYAKAFAELPALEMPAKFLDFKNDMDFVDLGDNNRLYVVKNPVNDIFSLTIRYQYGDDNNRDLTLAAGLMEYAKIEGKTMLETQRAFARLGADYSVRSSRNYLEISLEGKEEYLVEALVLLNQLVQNPQLDERATRLLGKETKTDSRIEKHTPSSIGSAMRLYAIYAGGSPYLKRHPAKEIKTADIEKMLDKFIAATKYAASIHYTGRLPKDEFKNLFLSNYELNTSGKREPLTFSKPSRYKNSHVYFIHDKKAVQSQVYFYVPGTSFQKKDYAAIQAFNAYFGDGFSGIVLQEIREYRSLAYSAWGRYFHPLKAGERGFLNTFVGCQSDKTNEAVEVMMELIQNLPEKPERMERIRKGLEQKAFSSYPAFRNISLRIEGLRRVGYQQDPNQIAQSEYPDMEFDEIMDFYKNNIQGQPVIITIYGDKSKVDIKELEKYGKVKFLKKSDVMKW